MTKLSDIAANPALKNLGRASYSYTIKFKGEQKKFNVSGHISAVHTSIQGILDRKRMTIEELLNMNTISGYHLLVEVTGMKSDAEIKAALNQVKWQDRFSLKHVVLYQNPNGKEERHILCSQWTSKKIDKLFLMLKDHVTVERTSGPETSEEK